VVITELSGTIVGDGSTTTIRTPTSLKRTIATYLYVTLDPTTAAFLLSLFFDTDASGNRLHYGYLQTGMAAHLPTPENSNQQEEMDIAAADEALKVVVPAGSTITYQLHYKEA
jgi:hypothetical protein